jgi:hypothetical protein
MITCSKFRLLELRTIAYQFEALSIFIKLLSSWKVPYAGVYLIAEFHLAKVCRLFAGVCDLRHPVIFCDFAVDLKLDSVTVSSEPSDNLPSSVDVVTACDESFISIQAPFEGHAGR